MRQKSINYKLSFN